MTGFAAAASFDGSLLIRNARLVDGTGAPPQPGIDVRIEAGRITALGRALAAADLPVLDAQGATLLPGLIDGHVHLQTVPGTMFRADDASTYWGFIDHHLRAYLAAGVTTVLDTHSEEDILAGIRQRERGGIVGPTVLALAPFLTPPGGHFSDDGVRMQRYSKSHWPPVDGVETLIANLERGRSLGAVGVKVTIEHGFGPLEVWPVFAPSMRDAIRKEAAARGMPLFVHSLSEKEHRLALEMRPRALVHGGLDEAPPSMGLLALMRERGVFVVSTLSLYDALLTQRDPTRLDDPLVRRLAPAREIETTRLPAAWSQFLGEVSRANAPAWMPAFLVRVFARYAFAERTERARLATAGTSVKMMYDAGIPLVMGTDAAAVPGMFHAAQSIREIELLVQAGLPPAAALQAATVNAARMLGIEADVGTVAVGKRADLVLVAGDPLTDVRALRDVRWTIKSGVARRPQEWMAPVDR